MKAVRHYIYVRGAATTSGAASPPPSSRSLPSPIPMVLPMTIGPPASPTRSASPGLLPTTPLARCSHSSAFDRSDRLPNVGGSPIRNRPFHPLSHLPHLAREMRTSKPQYDGRRCMTVWAKRSKKNVLPTDLADDEELITSPFISDTIPCDDLGIVEELLVEVGQEVKQDEVIAVIETHKAAIDVKASHAGVVTGVYVEQDEEVYEVQPMFMIRKAA